VFLKILGFEIDAVTFDVDGTLYDGGKVLLRILPRVLKHRQILSEFRRVREGLREGAVPVDLRDWAPRVVATRLGLDPFETRVIIEEVIYDGWIDAMDRGLLRNGVERFIKRLTDADVPIGIVSDYPADAKLFNLGLCFIPWRAIVDCEQVGLLKPSPAAFLEASKRLGIEPGRILHVGDREDCDVAGARAAGFKTALLLKGPFFRKSGKNGTRADITFRSYTQLLKEVE
jgi:putative hydrolase of the HAD superfamily